jgi:hypothetical protein
MSYREVPMLDKDRGERASGAGRSENASADGASIGDQTPDAALSSADASRRTKWIPLAYELEQFTDDGLESREVF